MINPKARRLYLHALTPLHSGVGQAAGIIDLPIARETATGWPVIPGSSIKGVLRSQCDEARARALFGSQESAGPVSFTDLRILCLPVRSFYGTFAWVSSPLALQRLLRDGQALGAPPPFDAVPGPPDPESALTAGSALCDREQICLEDLNLAARQDRGALEIATAIGSEIFGDRAATFIQRFAIVADEVFDFLSETATEVTTRIALGEDGTTSGKGGNLWYQEAVPAEALFYGWAVETGHADAGPFWKELRAESILQVGGSASVGRGLCRLVVAS